MKQVALIAAGSQPWNSDICAASAPYFAYCSSLAINVYKYDEEIKDYRMESILAYHKWRIACIQWNQKDKDLLASADTKEILVWNIRMRSKVYIMNGLESLPRIRSMFWKVCEDKCIAFLRDKDGLYVWNCEKSGEIKHWRGAKSFASDPCIVRCHADECRVAVGHVNGSVSLFGVADKPLKNILTPDAGMERDSCLVKEMRWDPLSINYLLVLTQNSIVRLVDVNDSPSVLMIFNIMSTNQLSGMVWVTNAPGMFITAEAQSTKLTLWNVSHLTPTLSIPMRVKRVTEFHSIFYIADSEEEEGPPSHRDPHTRRLQKVRGPDQGTELPPGKILCTFSDGGVGLYNLPRKRWDFYKEMGHVETVFTAEFHPKDPNILATGGYDAILKIWDISNMSLVNSMKFPGLIYSASWSPDGGKVAVATQSSGVKVWSLVENSFHDVLGEDDGKTFKVAWNPTNPARLASCNDNGFLLVRDLEVSKVFLHDHQASVFGCDWNLSDGELLATGCADGNVRLFRCSTEMACIKILSGHTNRVFNVKWSPIYRWILLSGSDDCDIRLWDTDKESCLQVFTGHRRSVRGLVWSPEVPGLFYSGSWDSLIHMWSTKQTNPISTIGYHGADVYGLTCHPKRPFLLASTSRDSTIRLTDVSKIVLSLHVKLLLGDPLSEVCLHTSLPDPMNNSTWGLCGVYSGLLSRLHFGGASLKTSREISDFFVNSFGQENLWNLVEVHLGKDISLLPATYKSGIVHKKHLLHFKMFEAAELCRGGSELMGAGNVALSTRVDKLTRAAQLEMNLGNLDKYCEILVQLREWDKALAVAPSVSLEFWRLLMERRCAELWQEGLPDEEHLPYLASLGRAQDLVDHYTRVGSYQDAMLVSEGSWNKFAVAKEMHELMSHGDCVSSQDSVNLNIEKIMNKMADKFFHSGNPTLAACCHISVDDVNLMMSKLIRGGEWELVITFGHLLTGVEGHVSEAAKCLARKCENQNMRSLAIKLLKKYVPNSDDQRLLLGQICCRTPANDSSRNNLYAKAGLPSPEDCQEMAEKLEKESTKGENDFEIVYHYLLSDAWMKGVQFGMKRCREIMSNRLFAISEVQGMIQMMSCLSIDCIGQCSERTRREMLVMSSYVGALLAVKRGYDAIVPYLFQCSLSFMSTYNLDVGVKEDDIRKEYEAWICYVNSGTEMGEWRTLMKRVENMKDSYVEIVGKGSDVLTGSLLPSHCLESYQSPFTRQSVERQGQCHALDSGCWAISINEAVMWAKVNNFSPICSGVQINPF